MLIGSATDLPTAAMPNSAGGLRAGVVIADWTGRMIAAGPTAAMPAAVCPLVAGIEQAGWAGGKIAVAVITVDVLHQ